MSDVLAKIIAIILLGAGTLLFATVCLALVVRIWAGIA